MRPRAAACEADQAAPPRSFDEFERRMRAIAERGSRGAPGAEAWTGRRAASLARRAGACDHLITAAWVHDFASHFDGPDEACVASRSAGLLAAVFPEQVLDPLRWLACAPEPTKAGAAPTRHAIAQGRRLRAYVHAARTCDDDALLSWPLLLGIARRSSLDG
ncbi:MAG TPA: hypothetical protein VLI72_02330 [Methylibium sp.]|nr:hypothetical protein [Methylibium sp.]